MAAKTSELALSLIEESPHNPRRRFDEDRLAELAASITEHGVLQPILVRPHPGGGKRFEIVCGARRFRAAGAAGLEKIPAVVRELDDRAAGHARIIENNQRADVTPVEEAQAFAALVRLGEDAVEIATRIGRHERYVRDRLALLDLPSGILDLVEASRVRLGAAIAIARLAPATRDDIVNEVIERESRGTSADPLSVSTVRQWVGGRWLSQAPWSLDDSTLGPIGAGACSACPYRASAQPDLFEDSHEDRCINKPCWDQRGESFWARRKAEVEAAGGEVIDSARKAPHLVSSDAFVHFDGARNVRVADVVADLQVVPSLRAAPEYSGKVFEVVYDPAEVAAALEATGSQELADRIRAKDRRQQAESDKELQRKQREETKAKHHAAMAAVLAWISDGRIEWDEVVPQLLQLIIRTARQDSIIAVCRRRGIKAEKSVVHGTYLWQDALRSAAENPEWSVRDELALLTEVLVEESHPHSTYRTNEPWAALRRAAGLRVPKAEG